VEPLFFDNAKIRECDRIAEQTTEENERERPLRMAEAWLQLTAKMKELRGGA